MTVCPQVYLAGQIGALNQVARAAELSKQGLWPMAGGWLEQTAWLLQAVELFWRFSHGRD